LLFLLRLSIQQVIWSLRPNFLEKKETTPIKMRSGLFISLALTSTLIATASSEFTWDGKAWIWEKDDANLQTRFERSEGSGNGGLEQTRYQIQQR